MEPQSENDSASSHYRCEHHPLNAFGAASLHTESNRGHPSYRDGVLTLNYGGENGASFSALSAVSSGVDVSCD